MKLLMFSNLHGHVNPSNICNLISLCQKNIRQFSNRIGIVLSNVGRIMRALRSLTANVLFHARNALCL